MKEVSSPDKLYPGSFDSHCHLYHLRERGLNVEARLLSWQQQGMKFLLNIVLEESEEAWDWHCDIAERYPWVSLSVGIHPNDVESFRRNFHLVEERAAHPRVWAIGETGLDFYRGAEDAALQEESLLAHIELAKRYDKPLVIHNRDADAALEALLERVELPSAAIMHCFSGNIALVDALVPKGFYFSFAGNLTYKNAQNLRDAARHIPLDRLLVETDAPFLAPQPCRGQINHSGFIGHTMDCMAELKGFTAEEMPQFIQIMEGNWQRLFGREFIAS